MPRTRSPPEFREQLVALVRAGRTPEDLAGEFEPTAQSISNWVAQADRDAGRRTDGLTTAERTELTRLRRENRCARRWLQGVSIGKAGVPARVAQKCLPRCGNSCLSQFQSRSRVTNSLACNSRRRTTRRCRGIPTAWALAPKPSSRSHELPRKAWVRLLKHGLAAPLRLLALQMSRAEGRARHATTFRVDLTSCARPFLSAGPASTTIHTPQTGLTAPHRCGGTHRLRDSASSTSRCLVFPERPRMPCSGFRNPYR